MKDFKIFFIAFLVAPGIIAAILSLFPFLAGANSNSVLNIFRAICIVMYAHGLIFGVPIAFLFNKYSIITRSNVLGASFLIGALPITAFTIYRELTTPKGAGYTSNGIIMRVDGELTAAGWYSTIEGILYFGVLGAASGLIWWLIISKAANKSQQPTAESGG